MAADPKLFAYLRARYEGGDKSALLQAIFFAGMYRCPLPDWLADAFKAAYEHVKRGGARSWDDAFGNPHPVGKHLESIKHEAWRYQIWGTVRDLHECEKLAIDTELFERVGELIGLSAAVVKSQYYEAKHALERVPPLRVKVRNPKAKTSGKRKISRKYRSV
jgi:hypothetical protein